MRNLTLLAALILAGMPFAAMGQSGKSAASTTLIQVNVGKGPVNEETLVARYTALAGSEANARGLVNGLRHGSEFQLTGTISGTCTLQCNQIIWITKKICVAPVPGQPVITITSSCQKPDNATVSPPTGDMGWPNVQLALAFTAAQFVEMEIASPSPSQLKAALVGGLVEYGTGSQKMQRMLPGILTLRSQGMGWPLIAAELEYQLQ